MELFTHILERAGLHFICSFALVMASFFALKFWATHNRKVWKWFSTPELVFLMVAALSVWSLSTLREPYDVANKQPLVKAFTDFGSWFIGCATAAWGLYRFRGR
jgi:hypothetical protein